jgi:GNAT superfamily N-acetyltransferase
LDYEREKRYGFLVGGKSWQDRKSESIKREILSNPQHWYVTEIEGKVIGFCSYFANEETKIGIVGQNGIDPEYAGKGIGGMQLQFVLDKMRQEGMKVIEVHTGLNDRHAPARRMYERAGFVPLMDSRMYYMKLSD